MIVVVAKLTIKPGSLELIRPHALACIAATRQEEGCLSYDLHVSLSDPDTLMFVETWRAREDLTAHTKLPHLAAWRAASWPYVLSRHIEVIHPDKVETF